MQDIIPEVLRLLQEGKALQSKKWSAAQVILLNSQAIHLPPPSNPLANQPKDRNTEQLWIIYCKTNDISIEHVRGPIFF